MSRRSVLGPLTLFAAACGGSSADLLDPTALAELAPSQVTSTNFIQAVSFSRFIPCANDGAGETVMFSGSLHQVFHTTVSASGNATTRSHVQPQGMSGTGLVTGMKYQGTGVEQATITSQVNQLITYVNNFRLIGQGPGNNWSVHENLHLTVHPDGTVSADHDNFSVECK